RIGTGARRAFGAVAVLGSSDRDSCSGDAVRYRGRGYGGGFAARGSDVARQVDHRYRDSTVEKISPAEWWVERQAFGVRLPAGRLKFRSLVSLRCKRGRQAEGD